MEERESGWKKSRCQREKKRKIIFSRGKERGRESVLKRKEKQYTVDCGEKERGCEKGINRDIL